MRRGCFYAFKWHFRYTAQLCRTAARVCDAQSLMGSSGCILTSEYACQSRLAAEKLRDQLRLPENKSNRTGIALLCTIFLRSSELHNGTNVTQIGRGKRTNEAAARTAGLRAQIQPCATPQTPGAYPLGATRGAQGAR